MRFLLFDVKPWHDTLDEYLNIAAALRPELDASGGCDFIDRFRRVEAPGKDEGWILSFQFWRDEASLVRWRSNHVHHNAQQNARDSVFEDYRLRVGEVIYSETPHESKHHIDNVPENGEFVVMIETESSTLALPQLSGIQCFESIYRPGKFLHVGATESRAIATSTVEQARAMATPSHSAIGSVERDYGMFERDQAPQIFAIRNP
jgi:heme-degrading monooxygenase HmoA